MFAAFDLQEEPEGELVIVNETDDGFATFERVAGGLGSTGTVAVGDRVWGETVLNLGRILGFERLRTGSALVNEPAPGEDAPRSWRRWDARFEPWSRRWRPSRRSSFRA